MKYPRPESRRDDIRIAGDFSHRVTSVCSGQESRRDGTEPREMQSLRDSVPASPHSCPVVKSTPVVLTTSYAVPSGLIILLLLATNVFAQSAPTKLNVLNRIASIPARNDFAIIAAKIRMGVDTADAYRHLDTMLSRAYGDMFWMYGCAGLFYATQDVLRPEYKTKIRHAWKHNTPYRGDTENHFLMYYGSLLLMSQAWPDLVDTEWFMGKSSRAIYAESKEYLDHWIDETARFGTTEWSSPRYGYYYITCLAIMAEYTLDARLKHRFEMMLEYMLADYASDYLDGSYCGAHSRVGDDAVLDPRKAEINSYGQYFFEDSVSHLLPDLSFAAMTSFTCPKVIRQIATDRSQPYEQFSLKRGRQMIRYMDLAFGNDISAMGIAYDSDYHAVVEKYEYMTKDYCLGSIQSGLVQPIQQQSWSLVFNSDRSHNTITGLHPYVSAEELGMFFPEYPSFMLERIEQVKKGYTSEDKWVGGSPYAAITQNKNRLRAVYELPDDVKYHHVDLFIPGSARWLDKIPDDLTQRPSLDTWYVLLLDSVYVGIGIARGQEYDTIPTEGGTRFRIYKSTSSSIFYDIFCTSTRETSLKDFEVLLQFDLKTPQSEEGRLFHSPYLESRKGSGVLTMRYKGETRVLDFNR